MTPNFCIVSINRWLSPIIIDATRSVVSGFSQGAVCALNAGLRHPEWFRGIVAHAPYYEATVNRMLASARERKHRIYLMPGDRDGNFGACNFIVRNLTEASVRHKLVVFKNVGHRNPTDIVEQLRRGFSFITADSGPQSKEDY